MRRVASSQGFAVLVVLMAVALGTAGLRPLGGSTSADAEVATSDEDFAAATGPAPVTVASDPAAVLVPPALTLPLVGTPFLEPTFGTPLVRLTGASEARGYATHEYSQLQAFSPDDSHVLLVENDSYTIRRMSDLGRVEVDSVGWNAPRWHPQLDDTVVHFDSNDDTTLRVQLTSIATGDTATAFTFPARYHRIRGNQSSEELSRDGRWMAGMASQAEGVQVVFALDLQENRLAVEMPVAELYAGPCRTDPEWGAVEPDWVGVSPLGTYLVVQWTRDGIERCNGLETFDLDTGAFVGRPYDGHQHGDLGVLEDGETEVFTTFELYHPSGRAAIGYRTLPGEPTVSEPVYLLEIDWLGDHISCQGPPGVCLVTMLGIEDDGWSPLEGELFLLYQDGSVLRLAHHRSSSCGYWVQPRATISRDGRYVAFASDWSYGGLASCRGGGELGRGDAYVLDRLAVSGSSQTALAGGAE